MIFVWQNMQIRTCSKAHIRQITQRKLILFLHSDDFCDGFSVIRKLR